MDIERNIRWKGQPLCYLRPAGSALIVGQYHYLYDDEGRVTSMQPVTRPVLATVLSTLYPNHALAMAANVEVVTDTPKMPQLEPDEEDLTAQIKELTQENKDLKRKLR